MDEITRRLVQRTMDIFIPDEATVNVKQIKDYILEGKAPQLRDLPKIVQPKKREKKQVIQFIKDPKLNDELK